jgi:DNA polymerase III alpha subunit
MTYYEQEWVQAYLEATSNNPKKLSKALGEVKSLGYKIVPVDINHAKKSWTVVRDHVLMPSFLSCKGLGNAAIDEIIENRPYYNVRDLLWNEDGSWKHSKLNKRSIESLIKIRAFDSMGIVGEGCTFSSYRHMHEILLENYNDLRKRTKKDPERGINNFKQALCESAETPEWTPQQIMAFEKELLGTVNVQTLIPESLMQKLEEKEIASLDDYQNEDLYWFMISEAIPKLTKNKKPYLLLNAIASTGKNHRIFCWGTPASANLEPFTFCVGEVNRNDFGMSTKWHRIKTFNISK